jgi:hypothetical protein
MMNGSRGFGGLVVGVIAILMTIIFLIAVLVLAVWVVRALLPGRRGVAVVALEEGDVVPADSKRLTVESQLTGASVLVPKALQAGSSDGQALHFVA